jgi:hypothetical protein
MKESKLYLEFFKKNAAFLLVSTFLVASFGYYHSISKQPIYRGNLLYEFRFTIENIPSEKLLADEAVQILRSSEFKDQMKINSSVRAFNPGPVSVQVDLESVDIKILESDLAKINSYLINKYQLNEIGLPNVQEEKRSILSELLVSAFLGLTLSFVILLSSEYFKRF